MTELVPLKHVATVIAGQAPPSEQVLDLANGLPFVQGNAEFGVVSPTARYECSTPSKIAQTGDILLSVRAPVGAMNVADQRYGIGRGLAAIRPTISNDARFVAYAIRANLQYLHAASTGTTFAAISADDLRSLRIPLPPLQEQRRIADFLDDQVTLLDRAIHLRQQQVALSRGRERALVREIVAGSEDPSRDAPSDAPWIARLHEQAEARPLGRTITLQRGVDLIADDRVEGVTPVVTTGGIAGYHNESIVGQSGVVIGRYGTVGSVFWVEGEHWPHNTTLYVKDYKGNLAKYVYYLLQAYPYERLQARAAVPGVNRNDMHRDLMPWLPLELQAHAVSLLNDSMEKAAVLTRLMERSIGLLAERKQALITAAVTGEFDVATARSAA